MQTNEECPALTNRTDRNHLRSILAFTIAALGLLALTGCGGADPPSKPNILFLLTDDQQATTLGVMGHPVIETPNLDRLANDGVLFRQMHVTDPTCSPSRTTYFTGQYERVHGVGFSSTYRMTEDQWQQTYPALIRRAGYHTGFIGKFGVEYYDFDSRGMFDFWRAHDGWARFFPKPRENCQIYKDATNDIITPIMGESVDMFLDSVPGEKPFCLQVSFSAPHGSITTSMDVYDGNIDNVEYAMSLPANRIPEIADHPIYGSLYRNIGLDVPATYTDDTGKYLPKRIYDPHKNAAQTYGYDFTRERCIEHIIRYYQCVRGIDEVVGRIVKSLENRGLAENTIIIYSADHGLLVGDYGMGGKALLYDLTTRVPFLIHDPRQPSSARGRQIDELCLSADVAPTILSLAGVTPPAQMQGRDLTPLINNTAESWREEILTENLYTGRINPLCEAIRTDRWKYIRYFVATPEDFTEANKDRDPQKPLIRQYTPILDLTQREPDYEHLFDVQADPGETKNLAEDPQYKETLEQLRQRCQNQARQLVSDAKKWGPM